MKFNDLPESAKDRVMDSTSHTSKIVTSGTIRRTTDEESVISQRYVEFLEII